MPSQKRMKGFLTLLLTLVTSSALADTPFNPTYERSREGLEAGGAAEPAKVKLDLVNGPLEERVEKVLTQMTLSEKIGQLCQISVHGKELPDWAVEDLRKGRVGSLFYTGSAEQTRNAQRIAIEESRLGLPLLTPRDVVHGFRTVFPIPLGQAAAWDPALVKQAAAISAAEARTQGVNWTFAPMIDIARDARWGRIAEGAGEDPYLASQLARAMVEGYQSSDSNGEGIAACGKHFAAYGLSEGGRDYNRALVSLSELHSVFLAPFREAAEAGAATFMTGFNTINGVPGTGHAELVRGVLKQRWGFDGLVVSDWGSVLEMVEHGYVEDEAGAAEAALSAGVDMEMATECFRTSIAKLLKSGRLKQSHVDDAVRRILRVKLTYANPEASLAAPGDASPTPETLGSARELARKSIVLLKNTDGVLPLEEDKLDRIAVIGPMANASRDQLGCWMLDGKPDECVTPLKALQDVLGEGVEILHAAGLKNSIDTSDALIDNAVQAARDADVAILCVGEGWQLSGEARCRVDLGLPGAQNDLVRAVAETRTPTIMVVLAGRPLTIGQQVEQVDAVLYAWHPGTMGGPALVDLLRGIESPSGKLPVTFPKHVGQIPLYYNHPNTGRPALASTRALLGSQRADFSGEEKFRSHYLDVDPFPLFPFGYGLTYSRFEYSGLELSRNSVSVGQTLGVRVRLTNVGKRPAEEVSQLYIQDAVGSLVRPVRELKGFRRVGLAPGESTVLEFSLPADQLGFWNNQAEYVLESGRFRVGVGGDSKAILNGEFELVGTAPSSDDRIASPPTAKAR